MATIEEIKASLQASVQKGEEAVQGLQREASTVDEAIAMLQGTTTGSSHQLASQAAAQYQQAKQRLFEATQLIKAAIDTTNNYRQIL